MIVSEQQRIAGMALGLRPHHIDPSQLLEVNWRTGAVPDSPKAVDNISGVTMGLDDNDKYGDCGPTAVDNHNRITTLAYGNEVDATTSQVLKLYSACTEPPFNPQTGANDVGVTMPELMKITHNIGLAGKEIVGYGRLTDVSDESIKAAIHLFGGVLFAVVLQSAQQQQSQATHPVWDYKPSAMWGGHAICAAAYSGEDIEVISWAMRIGTTHQFRNEQLDEVWAPLWPEVVKSDVFVDNVDTEQLAQDFQSLTDNKWPGKVKPTPTPTPPHNDPPKPAPPIDGDEIVWNAIKGWVGRWHWFCDSRRVARVLAKWAKDKGFEDELVFGEGGKPTKRTVYRSSVTGRFVSRWYAITHPRKTEKQVEYIHNS
jgi:hypothetical protein